MASLFIAGFIIGIGCLAVWIARGGKSASGSNSNKSGGGSDGVMASVAAILGLALTAYSASELFAPNTPVAASVPACAGVPVYGAKYYGVTATANNQNESGVNARSGPGPQFQQLAHYPSGCTLGCDGYCVGAVEKDVLAGTPDERWLVVRNRSQLVSAAFILPESAESALGEVPSQECKRLGGFQEPVTITKFSYNTQSGELGVSAKGAVFVGDVVASPNLNVQPYGNAQGLDSTGLSSSLPPKSFVSQVRGTGGHALLAAVICLAIDVPVVSSLQVRELTIRGSQVIRVTSDTHVPSTVGTQLAEFACNNVS